MVHSGGYKSSTPAALRLSLSSTLSSSSTSSLSSSKMGMKRVDLIRCAFKASDVDVDVVDVIGVIGVVDVLEDSFLPFSQNEKKENFGWSRKKSQNRKLSKHTETRIRTKPNFVSIFFLFFELTYSSAVDSF